VSGELAEIAQTDLPDGSGPFASLESPNYGDSAGLPCTAPWSETR